MANKHIFNNQLNIFDLFEQNNRKKEYTGYKKVYECKYCGTYHHKVQNRFWVMWDANGIVMQTFCAACVNDHVGAEYHRVEFMKQLKEQPYYEFTLAQVSLSKWTKHIHKTIKKYSIKHNTNWVWNELRIKPYHIIKEKSDYWLKKRFWKKENNGK